MYLNWFRFLIPIGGLLVIIDRLHGFSVTIPRFFKDMCVNTFFSCTARLRNSLPVECFPLTFDLNVFKCRISRHLLSLGSF